MRELSERHKWFHSKVGMRLYRNDNRCDCPICQKVLENGLLVDDINHANYLYDSELDYTAGGHPLRYFDTKAEATEFSVQQNG